MFIIFINCFTTQIKGFLFVYLIIFCKLSLILHLCVCRCTSPAQSSCVSPVFLGPGALRDVSQETVAAKEKLWPSLQATSFPRVLCTWLKLLTAKVSVHVHTAVSS